MAARLVKNPLVEVALVALKFVADKLVLVLFTAVEFVVLALMMLVVVANRLARVVVPVTEKLVAVVVARVDTPFTARVLENTPADENVFAPAIV